MLAMQVSRKHRWKKHLQPLRFSISFTLKLTDNTTVLDTGKKKMLTQMVQIPGGKGQQAYCCLWVLLTTVDK